MSRTHRQFSMQKLNPWVAIAVILLLLVAPSQLLAAPVQQLDLTIVGTWQSVPSTAGETVTISLFEDGTLQATSTYADSDDQILYGGTWETTGEDAFTLHIETVNGDEADGQIDFPGLVTRRGLRLPDAPDWGANGMTLLLLDESPTDFAAAAAEEVVEEVVEEIEEPVAEETPVAEEGAETGFAGVYTSGELIDEENGITRVINIALYDDGTMETYSSYEDADITDASLELGYWEDAGDGTLTIVFQSINGEDYDPEVPISFEILDGDQLLAAAVTAYSEGGLLVTRTEDELPSVVESETSETGEAGLAGGFTLPGLYTTGPVDMGGGTVAGVFVFLGEDGFAQSTVNVMDGESAPVSRVGEWVENDDGSVSITLDGELVFDGSATAIVEELDTPEVLDFTVEDGTLVNPEVILYPAGEPIVIGTSNETFEDDEPIAEEDASLLPGDVDSVIFISPIDTIIAGTTVSLVLLEDGGASLAVTSNALTATVVELGTWEGDEEAGTLSVTFTSDGFGQELDEPVTIEFTFDEATDTLIPGDYDVDHYGPDLTLEMVDN